ncbi:unnamed protein product [Diabrotica balteata]|uniref:non-specific serine/threonine protein kinase n=1 Tax=Diabrotica balteata TaxID=107213 RepID=A0A9N9X7W8_DIABA|nr:unnamed protein product [Diabrotica balteata]
MSDKRYTKVIEEAIIKKNLPTLSGHNTRSNDTTIPRPVYFNISVSLDLKFDPSLEKTYLQQIYKAPFKVGEGSFGVVWKAKHNVNKKTFAIKQFKTPLSSNEIYREIRNNERVGIHQNCVKYYMAWEECGEVYMMMEACQMSLMEFSTKNEVKEQIMWDCLYDICKALKFLHEKLLVHGDVKVTNIMLYGTYFKLADFGTMIDLNVQPESTTQKLTLTKGRSTRNQKSKIKFTRDILDLATTLVDLISLYSTVELDFNRSQQRERDYDALLIMYSDSFRAIIKRIVGTDFITPPTAQEIISSNHMKATARRWERGLRTVYTVDCCTGQGVLIEVPKFIRHYISVLNV